MVMAWAHQDCSKPLDLSEQQAKKVKQLKGQLTESDRKLWAKEEKLKNNEIKLVAKNERLEKVQAEVGLLKRELARLHADNKSLKDQLEGAKAAAANAASEY